MFSHRQRDRQTDKAMHLESDRGSRVSTAELSWELDARLTGHRLDLAWNSAAFLRKTGQALRQAQPLMAQGCSETTLDTPRRMQKSWLDFLVTFSFQSPHRPSCASSFHKCSRTASSELGWYLHADHKHMTHRLLSAAAERLWLGHEPMFRGRLNGHSPPDQRGGLLWPGPGEEARGAEAAFSLLV